MNPFYRPRPDDQELTQIHAIELEENILAELIESHDNSSVENSPQNSCRQLSQINDINAPHSVNLNMVSNYTADIYEYLFRLEQNQPIQRDHLEGQMEITADMRAMLIDWLNEMHFTFRLCIESFHMAVTIIDRYLQAVKDTKHSSFQLMGITALFLAAKYVETFPPTLRQFIYITHDIYTPQQIIRMERQIFKTIDFNLSCSLSIHFLKRFSRAANATALQDITAKYFLELVTLDYELAACKPSGIAAASLFLALNLLAERSFQDNSFDNECWSPTLQFCSMYSGDQLQPLAAKIATLVLNAPTAKLQAIFFKYSLPYYGAIATNVQLYRTYIQ